MLALKYLFLDPKLKGISIYTENVPRRAHVHVGNLLTMLIEFSELSAKLILIIGLHRLQIEGQIFLIELQEGDKGLCEGRDFVKAVAQNG